MIQSFVEMEIWYTQTEVRQGPHDIGIFRSFVETEVGQGPLNYLSSSTHNNIRKLGQVNFNM